MKEIKLTGYEAMSVAGVAVMRNLRAIAAAGENKHGMAKDDRWLYMIEGTFGEYAFAKAYGFHWHMGIDTHGADPEGDVAGYEVKTHLKIDDAYMLRLRESEAKLPKWYALVLGTYPNFQVHGCFWGPEALKHPDWMSDCGRPDRPPVYLVPRSELESISGHAKLRRAPGQEDPI